MFTIREIKRVASLEEAWTLNQKRTNRVLGGMLWMRMGKGNVAVAIDLSGLGLDKIEEKAEEISIGCMTSLRQLETHAGLDAYSQGAVKKALHHIVGVQFRNLATVGGSVYGRFGFSDVIAVLQAMDCYVELYKGGLIPLKDFVQMPYDNDILVRIIIKKERAAFAYQCARLTQTDFPLLTCSAAKTQAGLRLNIGARPGKPLAVALPKELAEAELNEENIKAIGEFAAATIPTEKSTRGSAEYRTHLIKVLSKRALQELEGAAW